MSYAFFPGTEEKQIASTRRSQSPSLDISFNYNHSISETMDGAIPGVHTNNLYKKNCAGDKLNIKTYSINNDQKGKKKIIYEAQV
jgi:hypothetical protein